MRSFNTLYSISILPRQYLDKSNEIIKDVEECRNIILEREYGKFNAKSEFSLFDAADRFIEDLFSDQTRISVTYDGKTVLYNLCLDLDSLGWKSIDEIIPGVLVHKTYKAVLDSDMNFYKLSLFYSPKGESGVRRHDIIDAKNIFNMPIDALYNADVTSLRGICRTIKMNVKLIESELNLRGLTMLDGISLTASQLSKNYWIRNIFNTSYDKGIDLFHQYFGISNKFDTFLRDRNIYRGGRQLYNNKFINKSLNNVYIYDIHSLYPSIMRNMLYPTNQYITLDDEPKTFKEDCVYLYRLKSLVGDIKENCIPVWQDTLTGEQMNIIREYNELCLWREELDELCEYYNLDYEIIEVYEIKAHKLKRVASVEDALYNGKEQAITLWEKSVFKMLANGITGKLGQATYKTVTNIKDGQKLSLNLNIDDNALSPMSILIASRITALGATKLLRAIRLNFGDKMKEHFIYSATDSIICNKEIPFGNGMGEFGLKAKAIKFILRAPNFYMYLSDDESLNVVCAGINKAVVENAIRECDSWDIACECFKFGNAFSVPMLFKFKNGKKRIYIERQLLDNLTENKFNKLYGDFENE